MQSVLRILFIWVCVVNSQPFVRKAEKYNKQNISVFEDEISVGIFDIDVSEDLFVYRAFGSSECFGNQSCHFSGKFLFIILFLPDIFFLSLVLFQLCFFSFLFLFCDYFLPDTSFFSVLEIKLVMCLVHFFYFLFLFCDFVSTRYFLLFLV